MMKTIIYFILIFSLIIPPEAADALAPPSGKYEDIIVGNRDTRDLLISLFRWLGRQKKTMGLGELEQWFEKKRLKMEQIDEMLVVPAYEYDLIVYPVDKNEIGVRLPNSRYRVLWLRRSIEIKSREDIEKVFSNIDNIRIAESILEKLPKKDYKWEDALVFNPAVFFWVQNMLRSKFGNFPKRYELERRLLFAVLFQQYPDLGEKIKKQLEEFSPKCGVFGMWMDLVNADRFILSNGIYKNTRFVSICKELAEKAWSIFEEIKENSFIERNSALNFCSSLMAIARAMPEFDEEKDFLNPEKIAGRLMSYIVEVKGDINLFEVLDKLEKELKEYQYARIDGLRDVLHVIKEALRRKESVTLEDLRHGVLGSVLIEFFKRIPKADLHHHLDGCISPALAFRVLQEFPQLKKSYPDVVTADDMKKYIEFSYKGKGKIKWEDLWPKFAFFKDVVNTGMDAVSLIFRESSLEDFRNDGVTLIEQKVSIVTPGQNPDVAPAAVLTAAIRGLIEAEWKIKGKLQTGLIPCIWKTPKEILNRKYDDVVKKAEADTRSLEDVIAEIPEKDEPEFREMLSELERRKVDVKKQLLILYEARKSALEQVKMVVGLKERWESEGSPYAQYLIGIDTVGDEKDYIRWVTAHALRYAAENGLQITEHLGENWNEGELKYALLRIKQGIESGIVKRIGHATALGVDPGKYATRTMDEVREIRDLQREIRELIKEKGIHIETCPSSNKLLVPEKDLDFIPTYHRHPVIRFFGELGNVSINTDDSWILHTRGLSGEFMKIWLAHPELTFNDIQRIINNGFNASFIDRRIREVWRLRHLVHDLGARWGNVYNYIEIFAPKNDLRAYFLTKSMDVKCIFDEYRNMIKNFSPVLALDYFQSKIPVLREIGEWVLAHDKDWQSMLEAEDAQKVLRATREFLALLDEFEFKGEKEEKVDLVKVLRGLSAEKVKLNVPQDLPPVFVPSSEIDVQRVFWNMISNSIRAKSNNITITADIVRNILRITVEDDGTGIDEGDLQRIFTTGYTTRKDEPGEHGLGLSYVWDTVVKGWGGKISVVSTVGIGTVFILGVPVKTLDPAPRDSEVEICV